MTPARTTEGVKPVMAMKNSVTGIVTTEQSLRLRIRKDRSVDRKTTCIPDTATMWDTPLRDMAVVSATSSFSSVRSPVSRAVIKGACPGGKIRRINAVTACRAYAGAKRRPLFVPVTAGASLARISRKTPLEVNTSVSLPRRVSARDIRPLTVISSPGT
jgi:hypothetical protein